MVDLARGIVEHFLFEIKHYGKILNGNRRWIHLHSSSSFDATLKLKQSVLSTFLFFLSHSYYLCRSQPPFLTDLIVQVFNQLDPATADDNKAWLRRAIQGAIREYHQVWMSEPRLDPITGLSRFRPDGIGIPPETEASHFTHVIEPYAEKVCRPLFSFTIVIRKFDADYDIEPHE